MSLDTFEQSLLSELRQHVATRASARPASRKRWTVRIAATALATGGAATAALIVGTGVVGSSAAYAVESASNGDVVVTIHNLRDAAALERALAAKGVKADVRYAASFTQSSGSQPANAGDKAAACSIALAKVDGALRFTLGAAQIGNGSTLDIITAGSGPSDVGSPVAVFWSSGPC